MLDILTSPFMLRAFAAAAVTGLAAPAVGTYLVQRRLSLMGDGIGHICVTGVALGLLTGTSPTLTAILVAVLGALLIELIRISGKASADVALALLFYGGIAGGLVLVYAGGGGANALQGYLFGSIVSISNGDLVVSVVLAGAVLLLAVALLPQLFAVANDEAFARTSGLPVTAYNVLISVLAAVSVSVAMRTVGLLLVSALMVIPVATAQQFTRGFRTTMAVATAAGALAGLAGLTISAFVDVPAGPTIVLVALAGFAITAPIGVLLQHRRVARMPFPVEEGETAFGAVEHPHEHGPGCGHVAVEHGDHVDYIHDGHRHAVHGGHYDEH
jgi:zinc transport system permease protein